MPVPGFDVDKWRNVSDDARFVAFVAHFNGDRDYYKCHELMEELWLEEGRHPLLQGLLQAAVGLHHWRNRNYGGATKLMTQAQNKLSAQPDTVLGLDLAALRADLAACLEQHLQPEKRADFSAFPLRIVNPELHRLVAQATRSMP